jgi:hypothetical protein
MSYELWLLSRKCERAAAAWPPEALGIPACGGGGVFQALFDALSAPLQVVAGRPVSRFPRVLARLIHERDAGSPLQRACPEGY